MNAVLRLLSAFVCLFPESAVRVFSRAAGGFWFHVLRYRRQIILANLAQAFPELDAPARTRRGKATCIHLVQTLLEFMRIPRYGRDAFERVIRADGLEHLEAARARGKGVLALSGHLGSFELVAGGMAARIGAGSVALVVKPFTPGVDRFVTWIRSCTGLDVIHAKGGLRGIFRALGRGSSVVFVLDQNATRSIGVFVDFFGKPACTMSSLAVLALRTGAPVIGVATYREPGGTHVLSIAPEIPFEHRATPDETIRHMTQVYTRFLEDRIREHPEQWLWTHRRWKTRPAEGLERRSA
jgi:KDO2-lipid IV(A) lauroyltransferase